MAKCNQCDRIKHHLNDGICLTCRQFNTAKAEQEYRDEQERRRKENEAKSPEQREREFRQTMAMIKYVSSFANPYR